MRFAREQIKIASSILESEQMMAYLYNGHSHIDNNLIENVIRPVALGRKNYYLLDLTKLHNGPQ